MFTDIRRGFGSMFSRFTLVLLVSTWHAMLAAVVGLPAFNWWNNALGRSPESARLTEGFNFAVLGDLTKYDGVGGFPLLNGAASAVILAALLTAPFVMGGVLSVLGDKGRVHSFMARFFGGGGYFYWRFLRLAVLTGVCAVIVGGLLMVAVGGVFASFESSETASYAGLLLGLVVAKGITGFFFLSNDYARIRVVQDDSKKMLQAYLGGMGFVIRHLPTVYVSALIIVAPLALAAIGYVAYETNSPVASTWGLLAMLFVVQQAVGLVRTGVRLALVDTEMRIYDRLRPAVPVVEIPQAVSSTDDTAAPASA